MKKLFLIAFLIGLAILGLLVFAPRSASQDLPPGSYVEVGGRQFSVGIADTHFSRIRGLSGREALAPDEGLFFIFSESDKHAIWMKDMNFSIDIVWANKNFEIVGIRRHVSPETFPTAFYPQEEALYVLETFAGSIGDNASLGDKIIFYPQGEK